jgi:hypothetical protein
MDAMLQNFVIALGEGHTQMSKLISTEASSIKEHVTNEIARASHILKNQLAVEAASATSRVNHAARQVVQERVLKSLKYEQMNARRNQIADAHGDTFEWILRETSFVRNLSILEVVLPRTDSYSQLRTIQPATGLPAFRPDDGFLERPFPPTLDGWDGFFGISSSASDRPQDDTQREATDFTSEPTIESLQGDLATAPSRTTFATWLKSSESRLFWISGKPGSGKSTLVKFLVQNTRVRHVLEAVAPNSHVLSHFLWAAGSPIERSMKGIFCSLLYQLLSEDPNLTSSLAERFPGTRRKDTNHDWSEAEAKDAFLFALGSTSRATCIFLDGLDELDRSTTQVDLHYLVNRLQELPRVKICISSRPEKGFQQIFVSVPSVRVQDLTARDIWHYACDRLKAYFTTDPSQIRLWAKRDVFFLVEAICNKADGVFLWVSLALRMLLRGLANDDSRQELHRRLEILPRDLNDLYEGMWNRLNEDDQIYRRDAARIFNTFMDAIDSPTEHLLAKGSVALILLTLDNKWHEYIKNDVASFPMPAFQQACEKLQGDIQARCAGLLEISTSPTVSLLSLRVAFVHRSAREFLNTSQKGLDILMHDGRSTQERLYSLAASEILLWRLQASRVSSLTSLMSNLGLAEAESQGLLRGILSIHRCRSLSENDVHRLICLWMVVNDDFIMQYLSKGFERFRMRSLSDSLAMVAQFTSRGVFTMALRHATGNALGRLSLAYKSYLFQSAFGWTVGGMDTIRFLLELGINPNARGIHFHMNIIDFIFSRSHDNQYAWFAPLSPAISCLTWNEFVHFKLDDQTRTELIDKLLIAGMDISVRIPWSFTVNDNDGIVDKFQMEFPPAIEPPTPSFVQLWADVNLSWLISRFVERTSTNNSTFGFDSHPSLQTIRQAIHVIPPDAKAIGIRRYDRFDSLGSLGETDVVYIPTVREDCDQIMNLLGRNFLPKDIFKIVPGEVGSKEHFDASCKVSFRDFCRSMVDRGLLVDGGLRDLEWPPKMFDD